KQNDPDRRYEDQAPYERPSASPPRPTPEQPPADKDQAYRAARDAGAGDPGNTGIEIQAKPAGRCRHEDRSDGLDLGERRAAQAHGPTQAQRALVAPERAAAAPMGAVPRGCSPSPGSS